MDFADGRSKPPLNPPAPRQSLQNALPRKGGEEDGVLGPKPLQMRNVKQPERKRHCSSLCNRVSSDIIGATIQLDLGCGARVGYRPDLGWVFKTWIGPAKSGPGSRR